MDDAITNRTRRRQRVRWSASAGALAALLALTQSASAGTPIGSALARAASVDLVFTTPDISLLVDTPLQGAQSSIGSQTFPGTFQLSDAGAPNSSAVATGGTITVDRTATEVESNITLDGLELTLLGETVVSATSVGSNATCPFGDVVNTSAVQAIGLRIGDGAPVDLFAGQGTTGSTTITDAAGQTYSVDVQASVFAAAAQDASAGLNIIITIGNTFGTAEFAQTICDKLPELGEETPEPGEEMPGPAVPDDELANSGTDTAVVAALLGIVLVIGGGSALLWARGAALRTSGRRRR